MMELCDGYDPDLNEYRFDRQARNFNCVLNFLSTGKLHLGEETCVIAFSQVRSPTAAYTCLSLKRKADRALRFLWLF